jgi:O-antigen/teichoic acid export membrane protein
MQKMQGYTIFGKQVVYTVATQIFTVVIGIIQVPIITKAVGSSLYGTWAIIYTAITLIMSFTMLSFNMSLVRFLAAEKDREKIREDFLSAFALVILSGVVFSFLFFVLSHFFAVFILKDASLSIYLRLSSVLILLNATFWGVITSFFRAGNRIGIFNLLSLGWNALWVGLTILFLSLGYGLTGVINAAILSAVILNIIGTSMILKEIGFSRPKFSNIKVYLKWGLPLTPTSAIGWIMTNSDRYIISYFLGVSAAGIYTASNGIGGYTSFALLPLSTVLYPAISKTYDEGKLDECRNYFQLSFKYLMMFAIPSAVGLTLLAKPLLRILTTPEFFSGNPVVTFAAFGTLASCLYSLGVYVIYLVGKTQIVIKLLSVTAVLNVILNLILIPHMGIIGAAIASLISPIVLSLVTMIVTRRYFKYDLNLSFLMKSTLSSGFMALCIWLINPQSVIMVFVSIIVGMIAYFGVLMLVKGFSKTELSFVTEFIQNSFKGKYKANN